MTDSELGPIASPTLARTVVADRGDAGRRVDLVLRRHLTDISKATRTRVQSWIEGGRVTINGRLVQRVSSRTAVGDEITIHFPGDVRSAPALPEQGPLDCLYEDDALLVVNKPAGIVSHPTFRHPTGSLLNRLLWHARTWPSDQRPSLVGRLDKLTSGAVVVAKTSRAHARLQRILASSRSVKSYLAVVYGPMAKEHGEISLRLRRDAGDRRRVVATSDDGLTSLTRFERLAHADAEGCAVALVRCQLATGRMHQIRVHLTASGWPLIGDPKYGEPRWETARAGRVRDALQAFDRQALHAWRVSFSHPFTGDNIEVTAPVPADMGLLLEVCELPLPLLAKGFGGA
ncbi:MAG: RluA family pseudouridine synthase [Vicinamibacterales bacterium]